MSVRLSEVCDVLCKMHSWQGPLVCCYKRTKILQWSDGNYTRVNRWLQPVSSISSKWRAQKAKKWHGEFLIAHRLQSIVCVVEPKRWFMTTFPLWHGTWPLKTASTVNPLSAFVRRVPHPHVLNPTLNWSCQYEGKGKTKSCSTSHSNFRFYNLPL